MISPVLANREATTLKKAAFFTGNVTKRQRLGNSMGIPVGVWGPTYTHTHPTPVPVPTLHLYPYPVGLTCHFEPKIIQNDQVLSELWSKQCSIDVLITTHSILDCFGWSQAQMKAGRLENTYPYPYSPSTHTHNPHGLPEPMLFPSEDIYLGMRFPLLSLIQFLGPISMTTGTHALKTTSFWPHWRIESPWLVGFHQMNIILSIHK